MKLSLLLLVCGSFNANIFLRSVDNKKFILSLYINNINTLYYGLCIKST